MHYNATKYGNSRPPQLLDCFNSGLASYQITVIYYLMEKEEIMKEKHHIISIDFDQFSTAL